MTDVDAVVAAIREGDESALARAITRLENRSGGYRELAAALRRRASGAGIIGVTGPPGVGKSTLVDALIERYDEQGFAVAVIAIDPSSPYGGGSILGDRVRLRGDFTAFVRSMSTRGTLGGVTPAIGDVIAACDAAGYDRIIVETVGAGQNEVDIVRVADTVCVVIQPSSGDEVQMLKAGILEIADLFVVNKVDLPRSNQTVNRLRNMRNARESELERPIVETIATDGSGVKDLFDALEGHRAAIRSSGALERRRRDRCRADLRRILRDDIERYLDTRLDGVEPESASDLYAIADDILEPIWTTRERTP